MSYVWIRPADSISLLHFLFLSLPVYSIIAPEDRAEFVDSLTNVCFGTQTALPQVTHIVKVGQRAKIGIYNIVWLKLTWPFSFRVLLLSSCVDNRCWINMAMNF